MRSLWKVMVLSTCGASSLEVLLHAGDVLSCCRANDNSCAVRFQSFIMNRFSGALLGVSHHHGPLVVDCWLEGSYRAHSILRRCQHHRHSHHLKWEAQFIACVFAMCSTFVQRNNVTPSLPKRVRKPKFLWPWKFIILRCQSSKSFMRNWCWWVITFILLSR